MPKTEYLQHDPTEYLQHDLDVEEFMTNGYCEACLSPARNWTEPNSYGHLELFVDEDRDGNLVGFLCPDCAKNKKEVNNMIKKNRNTYIRESLSLLNWPMVNEELLDKSSGKLPAYSDLGRYPFYYVLTDPYETGDKNQSLLLCVNCANEEESHTKLQMYYDINWESHMVCDVCGNTIEAAYNL